MTVRAPGNLLSHPLILITFYPTRLSREGQEERVKEALKNSLDECLKTSSSCHDLSDTHHPLRVTDVLLDDHVESSLDSVGKHWFTKSTAFMPTTFLEVHWKFQSGEHQCTRQGRLKRL
jgi:hypothetical protein